MPDIAAIRGILFDKDGTLVDFNQTWFGVVMALARAERPGDEAAARELVEAGGFDWNEGRFRSGSVVAAGTVADIVDLWHPDLGDAARTSKIAYYDDYTAKEGARRAVAIAGLGDALLALQNAGYVLGIATNDSEAGARATAEALGLADRFALIIGYDSVAKAKPNADQLHLFAQKTSLAPKQIAMVGDNPHDMEMARAAGAGLAIGVLSGNSSRKELDELSDVILGSVADLPGFFKR